MPKSTFKTQFNHRVCLIILFVRWIDISAVLAVLSPEYSGDTTPHMAIVAHYEDHGVSTYDFLDEKFKWSMNVGFYGEEPSAGPTGEDYPDGSIEASRSGEALFMNKLFMMMLFITGDTDHLSNDLRLAHHGKRKNPCRECKGDIVELPLLEKPSKKQLLKKGDLKYDYPSTHPLFDTIGVHTAHCCNDEMHLYQIGISPRVAASSLKTLIEDMPRRKIEDNLEVHNPPIILMQTGPYPVSPICTTRFISLYSSYHFNLSINSDSRRSF